MNKAIAEVIKNEITEQFIDNNGDLYDLVAQGADNAVIYYSEAHKIVNEATQEETEYASEQMKDTEFVFESMDQTAQVCAYWITEQRLREQYFAELGQDLERLQELEDDLNQKSEELEEESEELEALEELMSELQDIIALIENEV